MATYYSLLRTYMNEKSFTRIVNNVNVTTSYSFDGTNLIKTETNSTVATIVSDDNLLSDIKTYFTNKLSELSDSTYDLLLQHKQ